MSTLNTLRFTDALKELKVGTTQVNRNQDEEPQQADRDVFKDCSQPLQNEHLTSALAEAQEHIFQNGAAFKMLVQLLKNENARLKMTGACNCNVLQISHQLSSIAEKHKKLYTEFQDQLNWFVSFGCHHKTPADGTAADKISVTDHQENEGTSMHTELDDSTAAGTDEKHADNTTEAKNKHLRRIPKIFKSASW